MSTSQNMQAQLEELRNEFNTKIDNMILSLNEPILKIELEHLLFIRLINPEVKNIIGRNERTYTHKFISTKESTLKKRLIASQGILVLDIPTPNANTLLAKIKLGLVDEVMFFRHFCSLHKTEAVISKRITQLI
jgi:hypothetical protein